MRSAPMGGENNREAQPGETKQARSHPNSKRKAKNGGIEPDGDLRSRG